jgi:hypothetical protein
VVVTGSLIKRAGFDLQLLKARFLKARLRALAGGAPGRRAMVDAAFGTV